MIPRHSESFYDRMCEAQDAAFARRQRGLPCGQHKSWEPRERAPMTPCDRLYCLTYELETILQRFQALRYDCLAAVETALAYDLGETF
jgi:hypothetical protein